MQTPQPAPKVGFSDVQPMTHHHDGIHSNAAPTMETGTHCNVQRIKAEGVHTAD